MTGAGDLRHRIVLRERSGEPDGSGGFTEAWREVAKDFAQIRALSADARYAFGQLKTAATHILRLRWRGDVKPGMQAVSGGDVYTVTGTLDRDGRREWLDVLAVREE